MRLLVIEDERDLCEDIAKKLRLSGYEADTCFDGEAALELLAVEKYDLVLLDLNLPKVGGMTVLRTLREEKRFGYSTSFPVVQLSCGQTVHITKNFIHGPIAQLGARLVRIREVEGSNPFGSTNLIAGRTPEVTIVVLPYGFVLATQIKDRL